MSQPQFYKAKEVYGETYYQLPKVLFSNIKYKKLSNDAKVAYALLKDRFNYSVQNNWVDEDDNLYFIFTNEELMEMLDSGNQKVIKIKKELQTSELLFQKRMGVNKPNRLYLLRPVVEATDVYVQSTPQTLGKSGSVKITLPEQPPQTLDTSGSVKITLPENEPQTLGTSGSVKITHNLYKEYLDTSLDNIKDTQELDFSSSNFSEAQLKAQNQDLVKNSKSFLKEGTHELFLSEDAINLLQMWCNSPQQLRKMVGIILNAKNAVCKENEELGVFFVLEEEALQEKILNTLRRYFNAIRAKEKKITNYENYLFGSMKNMFAEYWNTKALKQSLNSNETNKENLNIDDSVWSNSNYENETSQDDLARLERVKLEALAKINSKAT
ncbi:replication initiator protein A [Lactococcus lactis]|uniref:replication initiator protein A n=1 Tax=Lactococcus lactis TaxID=1358 RepID=UPI00288C8A29|nr:replication initiator protein A [Lactococcus lactis]MDT2860972.1 replication initiator protein A [Lactococcus lactis]MDT2874393.1 replication initiator protein A [Lactococcus lactis]MDT2888143.1 replication initiator protein A [Lactococcus lactis]MDT2917468.1 replication initiator protein A [Lactococcus lactis]MDT2920145.1 replication initiator protein A [Lactococcus lactis]